MSGAGQNPPGWYYAQGDAPGSKRYWDGSQWQGDPVMSHDQGSGGQGTVSAANLATPGKRIGARLLDGFIWFLLTLIPIGLFFTQAFDWDAIFSAMEDGREVPPEAMPGTGALLGFGIIAALAAFAWETVWMGLKSATVGKLIMGMRVVDAKTGAALSWGGAAKRAANRLLGILGSIPIVGNIISLVQLGIGLASLIMLFSDDNNQTIMDKFASTHVVNKS